MVLSSPRPLSDLAAARSALAARLGNTARVSTLHDMLVVDVDAAHLVDVARIVRDDPATRCDLYSVNAGVDTGTGMRSVTFVRGTHGRTYVLDPEGTDELPAGYAIPTA